MIYDLIALLVGIVLVYLCFPREYKEDSFGMIPIVIIELIWIIAWLIIFPIYGLLDHIKIIWI